MFNRYTEPYVIDDYRRPAAKKPAARPKVRESLPKTKTKDANPETQPFRSAAINMALPDGDGINRHHLQPKPAKRLRQVRKIALRSVALAMVLIIATGGLLVSQGFLKLHRVFKGTAATAAALQSNVDPNLLKGEGDGRINVLLVGIGGAGHDGADLTDTLMLASIDPVNNKATLLSVPRDLWVTLPGKGSMKINAAYETGKYAYLHKITADNSNSQAIAAGFTSIDQTMESVLGVPINYNMLVDFQAFQQAVNTVNGVTVDVPSDLYDPTMAWENDHNPYLARAGVQTFDGKHALIYARSRETSSDFARSERQRAVLLALKQKAVTLGVLANPSKISGLISAFGNNVQTDLSLSDASRLYGIFKKIGNSQVTSASLAGTTSTTSAAAGTDSLVTTGNLNGQSIVMPKAGLGNYSAIQAYVHSQLPDGYLIKEHAKVLVVNAGSNPQAGAAEAAKLASYGYNVSVSNQIATITSGTKLIDLSGNTYKYTKHYLTERYGISASTKLPDSTIQPENAAFVVILGDEPTP